MPHQQLAFVMDPQRQSEWCWAAVSASVASYYGTAGPSGGPWQQCELANAELGQTTCCANGATAQCNRDDTLDTALTRVGHLASAAYSAPALFSDVQLEIGANHLVGVRVQWHASGTGHFVIIRGCDDSGGMQNLDIEDPYYGSSTYDYSAFVVGYQSGGGGWTHTYPIA
jgi:hypothetical protein